MLDNRIKEHNQCHSLLGTPHWSIQMLYLAIGQHLLDNPVYAEVSTGEPSDILSIINLFYKFQNL